MLSSCSCLLLSSYFLLNVQLQGDSPSGAEPSSSITPSTAVPLAEVCAVMCRPQLSPSSLQFLLIAPRHLQIHSAARPFNYLIVCAHVRANSVYSYSTNVKYCTRISTIFSSPLPFPPCVPKGNCFYRNRNIRGSLPTVQSTNIHNSQKD